MTKKQTLTQDAIDSLHGAINNLESGFCVSALVDIQCAEQDCKELLKLIAKEKENK